MSVVAPYRELGERDGERKMRGKGTSVYVFMRHFLAILEETC
jgi:hypothetical protein